MVPMKTPVVWSLNAPEGFLELEMAALAMSSSPVKPTHVGALMSAKEAVRIQWLLFTA
jgi:hypothetical protein